MSIPTSWLTQSVAVTGGPAPMWMATSYRPVVHRPICRVWPVFFRSARTDGRLLFV